MIRRQTFLGLALLLVCSNANASPNLSGPPGMVAYVLVGFGLLLLVAIVVILVISRGVKLARGDDRRRKRSGIMMLVALAVVSTIIFVPFVDFSYYVLYDNTFGDAAVVKTNHRNVYFVMEDGRIFHLAPDSYSTGNHKPGQTVVVRYDTSYRKLRMYRIDEATRTSKYHARRRNDGKKFWIPVIPVKTGRFELGSVNDVIELKKDWQVDELENELGRSVSWCCDLVWIKLLLQHGGDPNTVVNNSLPLYRASMFIDLTSDKEIMTTLSILELLLAAGADVNLTDEQGETALFGAARDVRPKQMQWLLQHGANPWMKNGKGETVVDFLRVQAKNEDGKFLSQSKATEMNKVLQLINGWQE